MPSFECLQRCIAAIACLKKALYLGPFDWIVAYNLGLVGAALLNSPDTLFYQGLCLVFGQLRLGALHLGMGQSWRH